MLGSRWGSFKNGKKLRNSHEQPMVAKSGAKRLRKSWQTLTKRGEITEIMPMFQCLRCCLMFRKELVLVQCCIVVAKGFWWNAGVACDPGLSGLFIFWPRHMSLWKRANFNSFWPRIFAPTGNLLGRVVSCWCFEASRGCRLWIFELECRLQTVWHFKRENSIVDYFHWLPCYRGFCLMSIWMGVSWLLM